MWELKLKGQNALGGAERGDKTQPNNLIVKGT